MSNRIMHSSALWSFACVALLVAGSLVLLHHLDRGKTQKTKQELLPANDEGVRQVVANIFGDAVTLSGTGPEYISGDFNGDGSEDLAVLVRPAPGKLEKVNSPSANWIIRDPRKMFLPGPHQRVIKLEAHPQPEKVEASDVLIAMIHGVGSRRVARRSHATDLSAAKRGGEHARRGASRATAVAAAERDGNPRDRRPRAGLCLLDWDHVCMASSRECGSQVIRVHGGK